MNEKFLTLVALAMIATLIAIGCSPAPTAPPAAPVAQTTQFATQAPAGAKVVKAFSKMDSECLKNTAWTIEATPDTWIDVGIGWYAKDGVIAKENWKHLAFAITLDGKEIKDLQKYLHEPKPFKLECSDSTIIAEIVTLEIYAPPLPVGDHKIAWKATVESDLFDGWDNIPKGTAFEFAGTIRVKSGVIVSQ